MKLTALRSKRNSNRGVSEPTKLLRIPSNLTALLLLFSPWWNEIEAGSWTLSSDPLIRLRRELPIDKYAADELTRRRKKIRKQGKHLSKLTTKKRHKLRIRAKKLRYASEFFQDVFPGKRNKRHRKLVVKALKELQGALGELNDVSARERMMSEVAKQKPVSGVRNARSLRFAAGIVYGSQEARVGDLLAEAQKAHAKFDEIKAFWK